MSTRPDRSVRFGKYDVTKMVSAWGYEQAVIEDKENNINSVLSTRIIVHSGGSNGTFNIPERKEGKMLNVLVDNFAGNTVNKDQFQFPAVLTFYNPDTLEIDRTYVYPNCVAYKTGYTEPDERKNNRYLTYTWKSEDTWIFEKGNYIYVDELTATAEKTIALSKAVNTEADNPILTVMVNNETLSRYEYSLEKDTENDTYSLVLKDGVEVEAGNKIIVVYETNSTVML
jgi:hypothetical protein